MVEYITAIKGTGKTRILAEAAVGTAMLSKGNVVYVDNSDKLALALPSSIRLINTSNYNINSATALFGFLMGLCAGDYDITDVFIDSTMDIIANANTEITDFMEIMSMLSGRSGVHFHFSVCDEYERQPVCYTVSA